MWRISSCVLYGGKEACAHKQHPPNTSETIMTKSETFTGMLRAFPSAFSDRANSFETLFAFESSGRVSSYFPPFRLRTFDFAIWSRYHRRTNCQQSKGRRGDGGMERKGNVLQMPARMAVIVDLLRSPSNSKFKLLPDRVGNSAASSLQNKHAS